MFTCTLEGPCSFCTWARVFIAPRYRRLELSCNRAIWRTNAGETALALWYHAAKSASCSSTSTHKEATRSDSNTSRGVGFSPASSRAMRRALCLADRDGGKPYSPDCVEKLFGNPG